MIATRIMLAATGTSHFVTRLPGVLVTAASFTRLVRVGLARAKGVTTLTGAPVRGSSAPGAACFDVIGGWPVGAGYADAGGSKLNIVQSIR